MELVTVNWPSDSTSASRGAWLSKDLNRGFSLIELLVVMAIMVVLMAFVTPAITSVLAANNLTVAGETLSSEISYARQLASSQNIAAEVRLIHFPDRENQGYEGVQVWGNSGAGLVPISKVKKLPTATHITTDGALSPFLGKMASKTMPNDGAVSGAPYKAFSIEPSGKVVPMPVGADRAKLYFTVVRDVKGSADPKNYVTLQLNPDTGIVSIFRP